MIDPVRSTHRRTLDRDGSRTRVAMSMLTLVPGGMGGSETYARELTRHLHGSTLVDTTAYVAQVATGFSAGIPEHTFRSVTGGPTNLDRIRTLIQARRHRGPIIEAMRPMDVVHYPFTAPVPSAPPGTAVVLTVHDVQHLDLPELFSRAEHLYRRRYYDEPARRADVVVTVSEFAKKSIVERLGVDPERVRVIHHGVDASAYVPNLGAREPFVFYPARGWAHKNHTRLVEAVRLLRKDVPGLRLVLTGGGLEALGRLPEWVDVRGLVPVAELRELYRSASCLVFPSLYEGFGLPPLEAMASGCPVAASDAGSIPEVCGDAAEMFDAQDPASIAAGTVRALERSAELQQLGLARARAFTWEVCAAGHEAAYLSAAGRKP